MKTSIHSPLAPALLRRLLGALIVLACFDSAVHGASGTAGEAKTYTLFMGADFVVEQKGKLHQVIDVSGDSFVINIDGKEQRVPMNQGGTKVLVTPTLKLTENSASLDKLKSERAYTAANDPDRALQRGLTQAAQLYAGSEAAANQINAGVHMGDASAAVAAAATAAGDSYSKAASAAAAQSSLLQSANVSMADARILNGPGSTLRNNRGEIVGGEGFDAVRVEGELTAPRALGRPFLVFVAQYRPPGAHTGQVANWIYARALKPIGRTPTKIQVEQGGFPPGFELQELQVHLYDQGEEIAMNISPKRVTLTRSEAHQYVVLEHIGAHKGQTLPAVPAMGRLPEDFPAKLASGALKDVVFVKVGTDGKPIATFRDQSCSQQLDDAYVSGVVAGLLFKPALEKGKPTDGVVAVDFAKLVL